MDFADKVRSEEALNRYPQGGVLGGWREKVQLAVSTLGAFETFWAATFLKNDQEKQTKKDEGSTIPIRLLGMFSAAIRTREKHM